MIRNHSSIFSQHRILIHVLLVLLTAPLYAQYQWSHGIGGSTELDMGNAIAVDTAGNVYTTGYFTGSNVHFGNGVYLSSGSGTYGTTAIFITKYNRKGVCVWGKSIPGAHTFGGIFGGTGIAVDIRGLVYVIGEYDGSPISFGTPFAVRRNSGGFLLCLDSTGSTRWVNTFIDSAGVGAPNTVQPRGITTDLLGNVYITGNYSKSVFIGSIFVQGYTNHTNVFIAKFNQFGEAVWVRTNKLKSAGVIYGALAHSISFGPDKQLYVSGVYGGLDVDFDNGYIAPKDDTLYLHMFTLRITTGNEVKMITSTKGFGNFYTSRNAVSYLDPGPAPVAPNENNGIGDTPELVEPDEISFYVTTYGNAGFPEKPINFGNGVFAYPDPSYQGLYGFLVKYNYLGQAQWVRVMKTSFTAYLANPAVDPEGNVYVCGAFGGALPVPFGNVNYTPQGSDLVIGRFTPEGEGSIYQSATGPNYIQPQGFVMDDSARSHVVGFFRGPYNFPPTPQLNAPVTDVFIVKGNNTVYIPEDSLIFRLDQRTVRKNDTAMIAVHHRAVINKPFNALEMKIVVDPTRATFEGVSIAGATLLRRYRWNIQHRISGDTLIIAAYGALPMRLSGVLFKIQCYIRSTATGIIPITFHSVTVNTGEITPYLFNGNLEVSTVGIEKDKQAETALYIRNYPNPFTNSTVVRYVLSEQAYITLSIYDAAGQLIRSLISGQHLAGEYTHEFTAAQLPTGIYFAVLRTGNRKSVQKLLLLK